MKLFVPVFALMIFVTSCKKDAGCGYSDSSTVAPATEVQQLQDSLAAYGITATSAPSGFFYKINNAGSNPFISNLCSNITLTYKGKFFNGTVFDSTAIGSVANFQLGQLIVGWQKGVPLIKKGGDIDLYIPPSLGFGPSPRTGGPVTIPGNSYLVFNVHIVDIQ
ncbi:MAG: FKBP-type peptidyl-prolyl cis-trans isomerase [Ginsengibacter sp.]